MSEFWGTMATMAPTSTDISPTGLDRTALRSRADELLSALAGEGAALREDQWTAIEALVVDVAIVQQRHILVDLDLLAEVLGHCQHVSQRLEILLLGRVDDGLKDP